jgi:hypothetical protein
MTIARIAPGQWKLRTRHDTLVSTGRPYELVCLSSRLVKDGWHGPTSSTAPAGSERQSKARLRPSC